MELLLEKLSKKENLSIIQKRYHKTEKGRAKIARNNEHRRLKTKYKRVMRELRLLTTLRRVELSPAFNVILRKT